MPTILMAGRTKLMADVRPERPHFFSSVIRKAFYALILGATVNSFAHKPPAPASLSPPVVSTPRINGPSVYGVRSNRPFLYRIPAVGSRPLRFSAKGLPAGLKLDPETGIISGRSPGRGTYTVHLSASNST